MEESNSLHLALYKDTVISHSEEVIYEKGALDALPEHLDSIPEPT